MPAIQLARLKIQTAALVDKAYDPPGFVRAFVEFLDYYADRTYRPGRVRGEPPLSPAFFVPKPVLREVVKSLRPFAESNREATLQLADALWEQPYFESRELSACLLGLIQPDPAQPILARVSAWTRSPTEIRLVETLVTEGLKRVASELPDRYFAAIKMWLASPAVDLRRLGLKCLPPLLESPSFHDLPAVFKVLTPLLREAPPMLRPDLFEVFQCLVRLSPHEAAYHLRQNLNFETQDLNTRWVLHRCVRYLPRDLRAEFSERTRGS